MQLTFKEIRVMSEKTLNILLALFFGVVLLVGIAVEMWFPGLRALYGLVYAILLLLIGLHLMGVTAYVYNLFKKKKQ